MAGGGSAELRELRERVEFMADALKRMRAVIAEVKVRLDELEAEKPVKVKAISAKPRRRRAK